MSSAKPQSSLEGSRLAIPAGAPAGALIVVYVLLSIANSLLTTQVPRRLLVVVGVLLLVYESFGFRSHGYEQYFLYVLGAWVTAALTLNGMLFGEWVQESVYVPGNIGVALALCRGHLSSRASLVILYGAALYFAYRLLTVSSPADIHHILVTGSANGISGLMVILAGLYYAIARAEGGPIRLLPAMVCLLVSALTLGRAGMAAGGVLLAGVGIEDLRRERSGGRRAAKTVVYAATVVALALLVIPRLEAISFIFERFSEFGLGSDARDRIWGAYGASLEGLSTLTGHGREEIFAGFTNVHNSYILWHKSMGVMAIPLYLLAALALARALVRDWVLFVILSALMLRAVFDELMLPFRLFDFLFFYLVCTALVTVPAGKRRYPLARPAEA
jgi:hypothetical protein